MKKFLSILLLMTIVGSLASVSSLAHSQIEDDDISGKVVNNYEMPMSYAFVYLTTSGGSVISMTITDGEGNFTFSNHPYAHSVYATYIGYISDAVILSPGVTPVIVLYPLL